jgi:large subunit ribosomal protein L25
MGVLHVDFARVSEHERVEVTVPVELRGQAPGVKAGGVVQHFVHEVTIECEAVSIPEKVALSIKDLQVDGELKASDIQLPEGAKLLSDPDVVVAQCVLPTEEEEEAAPATEGAEPELIGRKAAEEEAEE